MDEAPQQVRTLHAPGVRHETRRIRPDDVRIAAPVELEDTAGLAEVPVAPRRPPGGGFVVNATFQAGDTVYMRDHDGKPVPFTVKKVKAGMVFVVHESGLQMQVNPSDLLRDARAKSTEAPEGPAPEALNPPRARRQAAPQEAGAPVERKRVAAPRPTELPSAATSEALEAPAEAIETSPEPHEAIVPTADEGPAQVLEALQTSDTTDEPAKPARKARVRKPVNVEDHAEAPQAVAGGDAPVPPTTPEPAEAPPEPEVGTLPTEGAELPAKPARKPRARKTPEPIEEPAPVVVPVEPAEPSTPKKRAPRKATKATELGGAAPAVETE